MVGESDLLRTAEHREPRREQGQDKRAKTFAATLPAIFATRQIRGRFVRCHRTL
jgi:hypothetical protein